jgi:AbrB family looped-hinge helix DNA binding protein
MRNSIEQKEVSRVESEVVVVAKKGQITIPARLRKKFKIEEGARLKVVETEQGILFKPKKSLLDNPPDMGAIKGKLSREKIYEDIA